MKKILFLLVLIFLCIYLFAQDTTKTKEKRKNNAIKGAYIFIPYFVYGSFYSIEYERNIRTKSSITLGLNGNNYTDESGDRDIENLKLLTTYSYYLSSKYKIISNIWLSSYLLFSKGTMKAIYTNAKTNDYGVGLSIGRRLFLSKKQKMFFDVGFGKAYNYKIYKYFYNYYETQIWNPITQKYDITINYITFHNPRNYFSTRIILLLGYKF